MKLLLTGGAGFIGPYISRAALDDGWQPAVYDSLVRGNRSSVPANVRIFEGDICDGACLRRACLTYRPEAIVHVAAHHFIPWCIANPRETLRTNVEGTMMVARVAESADVGRVVFTSTADVYAPQERPHTELDRLDSNNIYGSSKIAGEAMLQAFAGSGAFALYILRVFNVVGPGDTNPHFIPELIANARLGPRIPVGNLTSVRDYVHARDVAAACLQAAKGAFPPGTYNVATGIGHSGEAVICELRRICGLPLDTVSDPSRLRLADRHVLIGDPSRLVSTSTWQPSATLSESLRDLWDHSA